jgi:hypothetical protein
MKSYSIVGQQHQPNSNQILAALDPGETVTLVREPTNKFDKNAIAVYVGGSKVGYIPSKQNAALAQFIDQTGKQWAEPLRVDVPVKPKKGARVDDATVTVHSRTIEAKFVLSPNSNYPMVEV